MSLSNVAYAPRSLTLATFWLGLVMFWGAASCAANAKGPGAPSVAEEHSEESSQTALQEPSDAPAAAGTLPEYFTVELVPGVMSAHGEVLRSLTELERLAVEHVERAQEAAVYFSGAVDSERVSEIVQTLVRAGYERVRVVPGALPRFDVPAEHSAGLSLPVIGGEAGSAPARTDLEAPGPGAMQAKSMQAKSPADVEIKTIGMHIGGGPNDEATKAPFLSVLEARRVEFQRCHQQASNRRAAGSFGVDLLIGARGGRAQVRDTRTRLGDEEFRQCVVRVFESTELPAHPNGKAVVISYSLFFKPGS